MCTHLAKLKYSTPTAVQQAVVPLLLKGRDVLMRAPTGTGKTLAYLMPLVQCLGGREPRISRSDGCYAIIITPTRELTAQVLLLAPQSFSLPMASAHSDRPVPVCGFALLMPSKLHAMHMACPGSPELSTSNSDMASKFFTCTFALTSRLHTWGCCRLT